MACIGFDLDETLGKFYNTEYYLMLFQPHISPYQSIWSGNYGTGKQEPPIPLSESLRSTLDGAFQMFIDCLAEKYKTEDIGLLRTGIVDMARRLHELKQTGQVRSVVIYSNNGNLPQLALAAGLIERLANAPGLFCNLVHWFHPSRGEDVVVRDAYGGVARDWQGKIRYLKPGKAIKTLQVLLQAFQQGSCTPGPVNIQDVYFFDDLRHPDIANAIGNRYFLVPKYEVDIKQDVLEDCFVKVYTAAGLDKNEEYSKYITPLVGGKPATVEQALGFARSGGISTVTARPNNTALRARFNAAFPRPPLARNRFTRALQTSRRLEQALNKGTVLSNNERRQLNEARNLITRYETENPNTGGGRRKPRKTRRTKRTH